MVMGVRPMRKGRAARRSVLLRLLGGVIPRPKRHLSLRRRYEVPSEAYCESNAVDRPGAYSVSSRNAANSTTASPRGASVHQNVTGQGCDSTMKPPIVGEATTPKRNDSSNDAKALHLVSLNSLENVSLGQMVKLASHDDAERTCP